jgi:hypothetical protein
MAIGSSGIGSALAALGPSAFWVVPEPTPRQPIPFWGRSARSGHGYDGPLYAPNPHDVVQLGNEKLPGICSVEALPEHIYDRQKADGRDGATLILRGYLPGPIDITWTIWTEEQWQKAQEIIAKIWRKPGKLAQASAGKKAASSDEVAMTEERAIDIRHPGLQLLGVQRVVILGISPLRQGPQPQARVINIKCLEYVPSPATGKVKTNKPVGGSKATIDQGDPAYQQSTNDPPSKTEANVNGPAKAPESGGIKS